MNCILEILSLSLDKLADNAKRCQIRPEQLPGIARASYKPNFRTSQIHIDDRVGLQPQVKNRVYLQSIPGNSMRCPGA